VHRALLFVLAFATCQAMDSPSRHLLLVGGSDGVGAEYLIRIGFVGVAGAAQLSYHGVRTETDSNVTFSNLFGLRPRIGLGGIARLKGAFGVFVHCDLGLEIDYDNVRSDPAATSSSSDRAGGFVFDNMPTVRLVVDLLHFANGQLQYAIGVFAYSHQIGPRQPYVADIGWSIAVTLKSWTTVKAKETKEVPELYE
jgi:hypothetical protein